MLKRKYLDEHPPQYFRNNLLKFKVIDYGGSHFSYMGGVERVIMKFKSYAEIQNNTATTTDPDFILKMINEGKLVHLNEQSFQIVKIDESYPKYINNIIEKYPSLIFHGNLKKLHKSF